MANQENSPRILLVDDESAITTNLAPFLERAGFIVRIANDGDQGLQFVSGFHPNLVILDVLMPKMNGRQVLRKLRGAGDWTPIILLTQVGEATERAMALEEGADDYINKPFDPRELVARIRSVLRRARPGEAPLAVSWQLVSGSLVFDRKAHRVFLDKEEQTLTPKAIALLEYLMTHPDELISRERLLETVWGWDYPVGTRSVDTRIAELRKVLKDDAGTPTYIETVPGEGYRFSGKVAGQA